MSSPESTTQTFQGSAFGSQDAQSWARFELEMSQPVWIPQYDPRRGDVVHAPGEQYRLAVQSDDVDDNYVWCLPLVDQSNAQDELFARLLPRKHPKRSLTLLYRGARFQVFS